MMILIGYTVKKRNNHNDGLTGTDGTFCIILVPVLVICCTRTVPLAHDISCISNYDKWKCAFYSFSLYSIYFIVVQYIANGNNEINFLNFCWLMIDLSNRLWAYVLCSPVATDQSSIECGKYKLDNHSSTSVYYAMLQINETLKQKERFFICVICGYNIFRIVPM